MAFMKAKNLLHRSMRAVLYHRIAMAIKMVSKVDTFCIVFCLLSPWWPPGQYGASSCPVVAFSGFYESPGPPSSGNARGIAPSHRHGYQKGPRWRCFCSLSPTFSPGIIEAKNHVMVCQEGSEGTQKGIPDFN